MTRKFNIKNKITCNTGNVEKNEAGIKFRNEQISIEKYNEYIAEIIFNKENLNMIFSDKINKRNIKKAYRHFLPGALKSKDFTLGELEEYVDKCMKGKSGFASYLAEALMPIVLRDILEYNLERSILYFGENPESVRQGVDACMYDKKKKALVLGEAKFYANFNEEFTKVNKSFIDKGTKFDDSFSAFEQMKGKKLIFKGLSKNMSDKDITIEEFSDISKILVGFVLHGNSKDIKYKENSIDTSELQKIYGSIDDFIMIHLPIKSKKQLIVDILWMAKEKYYG